MILILKYSPHVEGKTKKRKIMTDETLDRSKVSDNNAWLTTQAATSSALGSKLTDISFSRSSLMQARQNSRARTAAEIRASFSSIMNTQLYNIIYFYPILKICWNLIVNLKFI